MKNCIVLGSGRSGTSMVAGLLATAGYYMGDRLHRPVESNPRGFFESPTINRINDHLIGQVVPSRSPLLGRWLHPSRLGRHHMWLARLPVETRVPHSKRVATRIEHVVSRKPFCFKDPRFCYTLPCWRPYLADTVFICVFRDPAVTATSICNECRRRRYRGVPMNSAIAFEIFERMYSRVLDVHRHEGEWLFLHYEQVLGGEGIDLLQQFTEAQVEPEFVDPSLRRSQPTARTPASTQAIYERLCELAGMGKGASSRE